MFVFISTKRWQFKQTIVQYTAAKFNFYFNFQFIISLLFSTTDLCWEEELGVLKKSIKNQSNIEIHWVVSDKG